LSITPLESECSREHEGNYILTSDMSVDNVSVVWWVICKACRRVVERGVSEDKRRFMAVRKEWKKGGPRG
jgi:hypothetical protein